jgi:integrase
LRAALNQAVRWGWMSLNPATPARFAQRKRAPRSSMTPDEVKRVIAAAAAFDTAAAVALRLAAVTGARRAELASLRWEDLVGDRLRIDSSIETVRTGSPTDRKQPMLRDATTKTANQRVVALDPDTLNEVNALRAEREEFGPWMFEVGDAPSNPDKIGNWWRRARREAGVESAWRLHDLRHWSATTAIGNGHDVRTVAGRLGHANPDMALRIYAHALEATDRELAVTLARVLDT